MATDFHHPRDPESSIGFGGAALTFVILALAVTFLWGPSVDMDLTGDTYHWVQLAHRAVHDPIFLFTDLDQFYRPSATWLLAMDRMLWGGFTPEGYRTTSLVLHLMTSFCLYLVARRFAVGWIAATTMALVWCTSPFMSETTLVIACRHQELLLLPWLLLILLWPRADESWDRPRMLAVVFVIVLAAAAKETWVVTPGLIFTLEFERGIGFRKSLRTAFWSALAVVAYVAVYMTFFGSGNPYFAPGPHVLARIPSQLATFLWLEEPMPFEIRMSLHGLAAFLAVTAITYVCIRRKTAGTMTAIAILILPSIPTLAVPQLPVRYLVIPYAGFVLLCSICAWAVYKRYPQRRAMVTAVGLAVVSLLVVAGVVTARADLADYRKIADAHTVLIKEADTVKSTLLDGHLVLVVRNERAQPLVEILRDPRGFPKLPYTRLSAPYGLIDAERLFEWVIAQEGTRVETVIDWRENTSGKSGFVVVHEEGGFTAPAKVQDLAAEASHWHDLGRPVTVIRLVPH